MTTSRSDGSAACAVRRDSLRARFERLLSPGLGTCYRCCRPWKHPKFKRVGPRTWQQQNRLRFWGHVGVVEHTTPYKRGNGCFPLCEGCWSSLTPEERLPYYQRLVHRWMWLTPEKTDDYKADAKLIYEAVLDGK